MIYMEFQGKKQAILCLSFVIFGFLGHLCAEIDEKPIIVEEVHVGVVLDMGASEGKIILSCISMALSDFYILHNNYSTRVVLHSRDSNGKPLHALSAALDLLDNIKVEVIIGAQTRIEAYLLAKLGEDAEVPVMPLSQHSPSPPLTDRYPFFVEITQGETSQVMGISALIEIFKWREVILLYESTEYGSGIIPSLINSFQEKSVYIAYKSSIAVSSTNEQIIEELQSRFTGLSGEIKYLHGKLISEAFEIVNVIGKGERRVGYFWPYEGKITKESQPLNNRTNLLSTDNLEYIIWPGGSTTMMKGSKRQLSSEIKLRIGVPVTIGFKELVSVEHDLQTNQTFVSGFCVDVFETAIKGLPYEVYYEFIPFEDANGHMAGTYNDLVYQVYLQNYDAVVGDTTITSNRSQYVDFTIPYTELGVGMLVPNEKESMWIFLKPLSADLWITSAGFFILTGLVVWLIERPVNEEFQGTPAQQIGTILWFSFSTLVFAHREKLLSNLAKFVVIIWVFVVLILTSGYTATLASMMTVKQIQLNSKGNNIVYLETFSGHKQYRTVEQYADALSRGSKHGGVSAIIDEVPYIKVFLAKYSADYSMIKTEPTTNGFGFVFPKGSKLVHEVSRQIEILREEGKFKEMEKAWFLNKTSFMFEDSSSDPDSLTLHNFRGLFLVTGVSSAFALSLFTIFSLKLKWHVVKKCKFRYLIRGQLQSVRKFLSNKVSDENEENYST